MFKLDRDKPSGAMIFGVWEPIDVLIKDPKAIIYQIYAEDRYGDFIKFMGCTVRLSDRSLRVSFITNKICFHCVSLI